MNIDFFILMKSELSLLLIIFLLLLLKISETFKSNSYLIAFSNLLLFFNFVFGLVLNKEGSLFSEMYTTNPSIVFEKNILNFGVLVTSLLAFDWLKSHRHLAEFYILMLCTLLGMFYMISSGSFLMFYLGLELASIPLAAMANFDLEKRKSSEAAMKLILSSAFASGVLLFGISLIYGTTGTVLFSELSGTIIDSPLQIVALVFIFSGFAFKLSAVPFHFWTADVYEGAPVAVTSFLSVISKAATVFVFISVLSPLFSSAPELFYALLCIIIVLTISVGNLFAIRQTNIKRFLAFSSITQVGYILLGLSSGSIQGVSSSVYFLIVYLFSNLGAFGIVALVSAQTGKEDIADFKGFYKNNPLLSWVFAIALFSLAGIPPTAGFFGKMFLVTSGASNGNYALLAFAALNMVISLYYYLRVIRAVFIDQNEDPLPSINIGFSVKLGLGLCFAGILLTGVASGLYQYIADIFNN